LRAHDATRAFAEEHDAEASELERTIFEIDGLDAASDVWADRLNGLIALVKSHVDTEEKRYFPLAADTLSRDEADRLNREFLAEKAVVMDAVALNRGSGGDTRTHLH
jgi:hemerythrin-like domain-containing protein